MKFKVGDYVKRIEVDNRNNSSKEQFKVGEIRKIIGYNGRENTYEVEGFSGGNSPEYLTLANKLERALQ